MFKEIGSSFWLEPKNLEEKTNIHLKSVYISQKEHVTYSSSGRGAISLLLNHINKLDCKVLLPVYICEAVILPFKKIKCRLFFYDINIDLSVNEKSFWFCVEKHKPDIVFVCSYFGFDTLSNIRHKYNRLRDDKIIIIEDLTHSLFSNFNKSGANYYIASLRKWLALPDGGVAISNHEEVSSGKPGINKIIVNQNIRAFSMKYEYTMNLNKSLKSKFRKLFKSSEEMLNSDCNYYTMSSISKTILSKTDFDHLCHVRQSNYNFLDNQLKSNTWLKPVFEYLPQNIVPLCLPVYVTLNRDIIQKYFIRKQIYTAIHWPILPDCKEILSTATSFIYNNILSIPCDQRYNHTDLKRLINELIDFKG